MAEKATVVKEDKGTGMNLSFGNRSLKHGTNVLDLRVPPELDELFETGIPWIDLAFAGVTSIDLEIAKRRIAEAREAGRSQADISKMLLKIGLTPSSVIMLTGASGFGKTTLILQLLDAITKAGGIAIYNGREESPIQVRKNCRRLGLDAGFYIGDDRSVIEPRHPPKKGAPPHTWVLQHADQMREEHPDKQLVFVLDSLPSHDDGYYADGGITGQTQVRVAEAVVEYCKQDLDPEKLKKKGRKKLGKLPPIAILIGHVTKSGKFAGKNQVLHTVDVHFHGWIDEDKKSETYGERIGQVRKNRMGAAGSTWIFGMNGTGLFPKQEITSQGREDGSSADGGEGGEED